MGDERVVDCPVCKGAKTVRVEMLNGEFWLVSCFECAGYGTKRVYE